MEEIYDVINNYDAVLSTGIQIRLVLADDWDYLEPEQIVAALDKGTVEPTSNYRNLVIKVEDEVIMFINKYPHSLNPRRPAKVNEQVCKRAKEVLKTLKPENLTPYTGADELTEEKRNSILEKLNR